MEVKNIVVIGASAGGIKAVTQLVNNLPAGFAYGRFYCYPHV
jgi:chemotaxis response regulator CheB